MSMHEQDYKAAGSKVFQVFKDHPVLIYVIVAFIAGGIVTRLVHG